MNTTYASTVVAPTATELRERLMPLLAAIKATDGRGDGCVTVDLRNLERHVAALADSPDATQIVDLARSSTRLWTGAWGAAAISAADIERVAYDAYDQFECSSPSTNVGDERMSGRYGSKEAPVYQDGRLIGAIRYTRGFGWKPRGVASPAIGESQYEAARRLAASAS